ncbi:hypothetical protein GCM10009840_08500 [Pseudolysinimonas kribbensis]|jgi:predicted nucleic acid-binding protein|uniref:Ribonuclease VapC n=1 Tax=Pseudolysinimonas kribbensis TaxID=433641 RepID=A0ABQ6K3Q4_9MICO|nr:type II toxin-antitoxin system VapC family toxin [Pseudolysinimonas kribbensis]GMA95246.1 hypothetical protein GCM10025881_20700 [Pseudolysinimonas kribbensis]
MTVAVDASAVVEILAGDDDRRRAAILGAAGSDPHWVVPEHFLLEVISALRGRLLGHHIDRAQFASAVVALREFEFDVWPTAGLLPRIVELTDDAAPYDAAYLAVAEELGCPLVTADGKLARVPGITCRVVGWE